MRNVEQTFFICRLVPENIKFERFLAVVRRTLISARQVSKQYFLENGISGEKDLSYIFPFEIKHHVYSIECARELGKFLSGFSICKVYNENDEYFEILIYSIEFSY